MSVSTLPIKADRSQIGQFLKAIFPDADPGTMISLRAFPDNGENVKPLLTESIRVDAPDLLDVVCRFFARAANTPFPVVCAPPTATFNHEFRARRQDLANGLTLTVECDERARAALEKLTAIIGPPTLVVESGGLWLNPETGEFEPKLHLHWRLRIPTRSQAEHAELRAARALACYFVGADTTNISIVHPIRWPGTPHLKTGELRFARIVEATDRSIDLGEALAALRAVAPDDYAWKPGPALSKANPDKTARSEEVAAALAVIPNHDVSWDDWNKIGMATWLATEGDPHQGFDAFDGWSAKASKYDPEATEARWDHYPTSPPTEIGAGTLFRLATKFDPCWRRALEAETSAQWFESDPVIDTAPAPLFGLDTDAAFDRAGNPDTASEPPFVLRWHGEHDNTPYKEWLVDKTLPKVGTALLSGQWGTYKTFVGFDLSGAVITRTPFAGRPIARQGGVLWLAVEGQDEVRVRLQAIVEEKVRPALASGHDMVAVNPKAVPFVWAEACPKLTAEDALPKLRHIVAAAARGLQERHALPLALILIDTLSPAAEFRDANDTAENQRVMSVLKTVAREFECLLVAVDHFGKDTSTGTRNSSVKEADVDAVLALLGEKDLAGNVTNPRMAVRKVRGATTGAEIRFDRRIVPVRAIGGEEAHTTLVIDWLAAEDISAPREKRWPKSLAIFKRSLDIALQSGSTVKPLPDNVEVMAVDREVVRDEFMKQYPADETKAKGQAFRRSERDAITTEMMGSRVVEGRTLFWRR